MNIRLKHEYRGWKSKERLIPAGDYNENDERVFGIAPYLVEMGLAIELDERAPLTSTNAFPVVIDDAEAGASYQWETMSHIEAMEALGRDLPSDDTDEIRASLDYEDMTLVELRAECERRGIDLEDMEGSGANGRLLKDDLVEILRGDDMDAAG